jgi:periplasmic copper chaperone A
MRHVDRADKAPPGQRRLLASVVAIAAAIMCGAACAYGVFTVNQPWVRPGSTTTEAYMVLASSEGATLVAARSSLAAKAVLRGSHPARSLALIPLPAGKTVSLRRDGERIVLLGLKHELKLGDRVPLTLVLETAAGAQEVAVDAEVRNESPVDAELRVHRR